jgi:hypothetical protein
VAGAGAQALLTLIMMAMPIFIRQMVLSLARRVKICEVFFGDA